MGHVARVELDFLHGRAVIILYWQDSRHRVSHREVSILIHAHEKYHWEIVSSSGLQPNSSNTLADVRASRTSWDPVAGIAGVISLGGWQWILQIFVAGQALEGQSSSSSLFLVLSIVSHQHHDFFYLILNELKGSSDLILVSFLGHILREEIQPLADLCGFLFPDSLL